MSRSPCPARSDTVVAILGVLRAGFAYVALDPGYPAALLGLICEDAGITAVVTRSDVPPLDTPGEVPVILLDTLEPCAAGPDAVVSAGHGAYTIYTSGSTGRPKGVRSPTATSSTSSPPRASGRAWTRPT